MPSLFHKRRGSDIPPEIHEPSATLRAKMVNAPPPVDHSRGDTSAHPSSPPAAHGGKLRNFLRGSVSEESKESMRRRLSSPSELFKPRVDAPRSDITAGWEEVNGSPSAPAAGSSARNIKQIPLSPSRANGNGNRSSVLFAENFSLSQTASPESSPIAAKRGSKQWTPSYPLVVPDGEDQYADIAPDGQINGGGSIMSIPVASGDENSKRRSTDMRSLAQWEPLKPDSPKKAPSPSTPPRRAESPPSAVPITSKPQLQLQTGGFVKPTTNDTEPLLASEPSSRRESEEPLVATPVDTLTRNSLDAIGSPTSYANSSIPASPMASTTTPLMSPIPGMIVGPNGKMRPAMPSRRTTLIQSPPMPQPIRNLPTMQGWPGLIQTTGGVSTPGWGGMGGGASGVPRTPGWGGLTPSGPVTPRTPGGAGFPFSFGGVGAGAKDKGKAASSEEELRKMRRAMPVMLRQASTIPVPIDDGGEAGDDDDDDDGSDTEVEGGGDDDDSEPETETEPSPMKGKGKAKGLSPLDRLKGKSKGKSSTSGKTPTPSSSLRNSTVREEEESSGPAPQELSLLERRAKISPGLMESAPVVPSKAAARGEVANKEPQWSIGNESGFSGGWTSFASTTPSLTPFKPIPKTSKTPGSDLRKTSNEDGGYFGAVTTSAPAAPIVAPVDSQNMSNDPEAPPLAPPIPITLAAPVEASSPSPTTSQVPLASPSSIASSNTGEGNDGSEEGSQSNSPHSTNTSLPQSPALIEHGRPTPSKRPSLYQQATSSLENLRSTRSSSPDQHTPEDVEMEPTLASTAAAMPRLTPITSGEAIRSKALPQRIEIPKRQSFIREAATPQTPGWLKAPPTPATPGGAGQVFWASGRKAGEGSEGKMKRRRSAGDLQLPPPDYEPPHPGVVIPRPRDDEGREVLPDYWCAVHIEGMLSRKMEFSAPGVQARDRSWKKYYCILRGTSFTLYKFDPRRFVPKEGAPPAVAPITEEEEEEFLHVHLPADQQRRGSISSTAPGIHGTAVATARRGSVGDTSIAAIAGARRGSISTTSPLNPTDRSRAGSGSSSTPGYAGFESGRRGSLSGPSSNISVGQSSDSSSRRTSVSGSSAAGGSSFSVATPASSSSSAEKDPALFAKTNRRPSVSSGSTASTSGTTSALAHFQTNHLVKTYTLQNAESGLAADYVKRKNVVRIRSEGEQFLLQTEGAREVVDWIEAFQAATNVALDLDDRPMPKIITLPRRRRRRPAAGAVGAAGATTTPPPGAVVTGADTPEANIRAVQEAERASRAMDRDLAVDQANQ